MVNYLQLLAVMPLTVALSCKGGSEGLSYPLVTAIIGSALAAGGLVLWLWAPVMRQSSTLGCLGAFVVALMAMANWTMATAFLLGMAVVSMAALLSGAAGWPYPTELAWPFAALVAAGVSFLVIQSRPLRDIMWDGPLADSRNERILLMFGLGYLGAAIVPSVFFAWAVWMFATVGACDSGWL